LLHLLEDRSERVKFHAAIAVGHLAKPSSAQLLLKMARSIKTESDTYLRHAAIVGLTGCASTDFLTALAKDESELIQKIAVVALRRRAEPVVAHFLNSRFEQVTAEAARAIHDDWTIPEGMRALASYLETTHWIKNESIIRRAINANFHFGSLDAAKRVAAFALRPGVPETLQLDALDALSQWTNPRELDRVVGRYRPLEKRDPAIVEEALKERLAALLSCASQKIQSQTMSLARSLKIEIPAPALVALAGNKTSSSELRIETLRSLATQKHPAIEAVLAGTIEEKDEELRIASLKLLAEINLEIALDSAQKTLTQNTYSIREKQTTIRLLTKKLASKKGDDILKKLVNQFEELPVALQLDLTEAAATRNLKAPAPDFAHTLQGGDAVKGKELFMNHLASQCIRCHKVAKGKGSDIGPNLQSVGLKERTHLLESIIDPQKIITDGYGTISLTLKDGKSVAGLFLREKNGVIEIRDPEGKTSKVKSSDVRERSPVISIMPPMGQILKKREIRDLIEYLSTLKMN
jgi:quinoprotein glucose dehydrogenase